MHLKSKFIIFSLVVVWAPSLYGAVGLASAQTYPQYIPAIAMTESYDSNVFFNNIPGDKSDFITTITPSIRTDQRGRLINWGGSLLLNGSIYAKNPGLNYISVS